MMGTEIFEIDASWAEKLRKTRVPFLMTPTVCLLIEKMTYSDPIVTLVTLK